MCPNHDIDHERADRPRPLIPAASTAAGLDLVHAILAILAPVAVAAPFATWGASAAQAAPRASAVWFVAPGGAASAPCGTTKATACALINTAIGEAAAGDTIRVAAGTYTSATASGLVVVTKNLALTGAGASDVTLDGNGLGTVLTVDAGVTATVKGFTITGGTGTATTSSGVPAQAGGGVFSAGTLTLTNDTVTGNQVSVTGLGRQRRGGGGRAASSTPTAGRCWSRTASSPATR